MSVERDYGAVWIEYHETYFASRTNPEITVLFWRCRQFKKWVRRTADCITFYGDGFLEAERKMVEWIDRVGAVERPSRPIQTKASPAEGGAS